MSFQRRLSRVLSLAALFVTVVAGAQGRPESGPGKEVLVAVAGQHLVAVLNRRDMRIVDGVNLREALEAAPSAQPLSAPVSRIVCDRFMPTRCFVGRALGNSERASWSSLDLLSGQPIEGWPAFPLTNARLEAVDFRNHMLIWSAGKLASIRPGDLAPGLYLSRPGQPVSSALTIAAVPDENGFPHAEIVGTTDRPWIFVRTTGVGGAWSLYDANGKLLSSVSGGDGYVGADAKAAYFVAPAPQSGPDGSILAAGSLASVRFDDAASGSWRVKPIYFAGPANPALDRRAPSTEPLSPGGSLAFVSGRAIAVSINDKGPTLVELCGRGGLLQAKPLRLNSTSARFVGLSGGGQIGVASAVMSDGLALQTIVTFVKASRPSTVNASFAACDAVEPNLQPVNVLLQGSIRQARTVVTLSRGEAVAPDGKHVSYTILSNGAHPARVMVRGYGAYGIPVTDYLSSAFERAWVAEGNAIVVPVLRGDGGRGKIWEEQGRGDYKARASSDLIAVAEDLRKRGIVTTPQRIDLLGISAGAFTSAKAALFRPDLFDAVLLVSGALDLDVIGARQPADAAEYGPVAGGFERWFGAKASSGNAPPRFLLVHDAQDDQTAIENSIEFAKYLKSLGYHGGLIETRGQGHGDLNDPRTIAAVLGFIAEGR